jgi:2-polyprenyl-3-methyl-5-hydroxy-6-metoxy-1,4-benzoquinol methylase
MLLGKRVLDVGAGSGLFMRPLIEAQAKGNKGLHHVDSSNRNNVFLLLQLPLLTTMP